jgi:tetratricopeptide (TPR) repeat protein
MNMASKLAVLFLLQSLTGCVTTGSGTSGGSIPGQESDSLVVQRVGARDTIISPFGKNHWYSARQQKEGGLGPIQGMLATGEGPGAEQAARTFLQKNPGHPEGLISLASALALTGQYDLAGFYAKLAAQKLPNDSRTINIQALAILMRARNMSDYRSAERLLQKSFDSSPQEIAAGLNLGSLYLELGNAAGAAQIFEQTSSRCKLCAASELGLGIAKMRLKRFDEAEKHLLVAIKNNQEKTKGLYYLALVYKNGLNSSQKAESTLRTLLAEGSKKDPVTLRLGHTLLRKIKAEQAHRPATAVAKRKNAEKNQDNYSRLVQDTSAKGASDPNSDLGASDNDFVPAPTLTGN